MLLPQPMSRILVVGTKDRLPATIELLYTLENVHLVDFSPEEGFSIGAPLPEASEASSKLLKLRSVQKDLEVEETKEAEAIAVSKIKGTLSEAINDIEMEIRAVVESKNAKQIRLSEADAKLKALQPFKGIPLDLEMYRGYGSLDVFTGTISSNPEPALREALKDNYELFVSDDGSAIALFVPVKNAEEAQRVLAQSGYVEVPPPEGVGRPQDMMVSLEKEIEGTKKDLEETSERLEKLREKHAAYLLASDEYLSIEVEKAELPLRMGASEHSFIIEAWVPTADYDKTSRAFADKFGDDIHVELLENKDRTEHHEEHAEEEIEAGVLTAEAVTVPISQETPVKTEHGKNAGRFSFFTKLLSTPRYNEVDPTAVLGFFFPLFFGIMVGDVGYGIPFTVLGYLGLRKCTGPEWRAISTMLFYGGLWSIFFGIFLFGDMLGIEFTALHEAVPGEEGLFHETWSSLLGIEIPHVLFDLGFFSVQLGYFAKLQDVEMLLYISVWIGIAHLMVGLGLGFYNLIVRHGLKHAVLEKFSWMMMLAGFALLLIVVIDVIIRLNPLEFTNPIFLGGLGLLLVGLVLAVKGEGGKALIELPELMSNVLSYTRLIAIGMSKAGMALAFNFIAIGMIAHGSHGDPVMGIMALLIFVMGHLMIFMLAIISAGLHGVRLQYVELFTKFYEGGGQEFDPLRIRRKYTKEE